PITLFCFIAVLTPRNSDYSSSTATHRHSSQTLLPPALVANLGMAQSVYEHHLACGHSVEGRAARCAQAGDTGVDNSWKVRRSKGQSLWTMCMERSRWIR